MTKTIRARVGCAADATAAEVIRQINIVEHERCNGDPCGDCPLLVPITDCTADNHCLAYLSLDEIALLLTVDTQAEDRGRRKAWEKLRHSCRHCEMGWNKAANDYADYCVTRDRASAELCEFESCPLLAGGTEVSGNTGQAEGEKTA